MTGNLIIISAPSGAGKGTLIREVLAEMPGIGYSVSFTTREKRIGEEDGREYNFISRAEFDELVSRGELLEYAEVHGNFYGTSLRAVEEMMAAGKDVLLEIDVQGAGFVMKKMPGAVSIFIMPPNFEVLRARLVARATETPEALALRLRNSIDEVRQFEFFDYVVVNDEIFSATNRIKSVIRGERQKRTRQLEAIQDILDSFDVSKVNAHGDNT
jgi:guanylate kinase